MKEKERVKSMSENLRERWEKAEDILLCEKKLDVQGTCFL